MSEVWFIRHGESASNAGEIILNRYSHSLTDKGRRQAESLPQLFVKPPELIVTSPFVRARETAEPLKRKYPDVPCEEWPVYEICHVADEHYSNKSIDHRRPIVQEYWQRCDPDYVDGEGAESFNHMVLRVKDCFERLQNRSEDFIAVFTHGLFMHAISVLLQDPSLSGKDLMQEVLEHNQNSKIANCDIIKTQVNGSGITRI